jgi:hypothetical protein
VIAAELACYVDGICGRITTEAERRVPEYAYIKRLLRAMAADRAEPLGDDAGRVDRIMARVDAAKQSGYLMGHMAAAERMATGKGTNGNGHGPKSEGGD